MGIKPLLTLNDVKAYYVMEDRTVKAVDGVSLDVYEGEIIGVVGESGSGKSTMANVILMNIVKPLNLLSGEILFKTRDENLLKISSLSRDEIKERLWGKEMVMIPQAAMNALMPTIKIKKYISDLATSHGLDKDYILSKAEERFEQVGLERSWLDRYPFELSGGMKQRAVIAIATLLDPPLLIADEPTSALDVVNQKIFLKSLLDLKSRDVVKSVIFITHDVATIRQIADRIVVMYAGKIVEVSRTDDLIKNPLHPYTEGLIRSVLTPEPAVKKRGLHTIPGSPPNLVDPPKGCRFHPRCEYAMDICKRSEPSMVDIRGAKVACFRYGGDEK